ncbi:MAG: type IV pilus secretin PilQ [Vicinamibacterales bacterium]
MLIAACAVAAISGGGLVLTASPAPEVIRLVGVSAQATGRTAALVIQATGPAAYAISRPDPLTLLVDLRNATLGESATNVAPTGPIKSVSLEQATAIDGGSLARVRVALVAPVQYSVHSDRNVIRLDLEGQPVDKNSAAHAALVLPAASPVITTAAATFIEKVHASNTRTSTTVVLSGNGRLNPASLTESDAPRRLVLDFPDVSSRAPAQVSVDSAFVKKVRVALNSHDPLVTRVVMEIAPKTTYHVERTGADGRDLALVFEGAQPGAAVLVAPPTTRASANDDDAPISLAQALSNGASLTPHDPIDALLGPDGAPIQSNVRVLPPTSSAARVATAAMTQTPSTGAVQAPSTSAGPQPPVPTPGASQSTPPQRPGQPTMSAPVPGSGATKYTGHPISFDFEDTDLRSVLRVFAQESGLNMIIDPTVQGRVNVLLTDVPWDQALDQILRANKLGYTVDGNIIRIAPLAVLADEQAQTQKLNEAKQLAGELIVKTFPLSYAKADTLAPLLVKSALSARGQIQTDARTNTLIVMDLPDHLQTAASLIATLDKPQPQVDVEARIVQTTRQFARALGVQWGLNGRATQAIGNTLPLTFPNNVSVGGAVGTQTGAGSGGTVGPNDPRGGTQTQNTATVVNLPAAGATSAIGIALGSISGAFNLDVALSALENTGKGRILSTPRLTTQNNQPAEIAQGIEIPIQTVANNTVAVSFRDATLKLDVTPQITAANTVIMNIQVANETPDFSNEVNGIPPINTQRAQTTVQVDDGATTVIGGIFVSQQQTTDDHTPALYRVPILRWLFQSSTSNDSSNELLIFITPKILRG